MSIYLDTSALAKLIVVEAESGALRTWVQGHPGVPLMTNVIGAVELRRLAARIGPQATSAAVLLLARIDLLSLTPGALAAAAELPPPEVRTLDALHLASAAEVSDLGVLVTYDRRMHSAAESFGLVVQSPAS